MGLAPFQQRFAASYEQSAKAGLESYLGRKLTDAEEEKLAVVASSINADHEAVIYNPMTDTRTPTSLSNVAGWIRAREAIVTGHGTVFKRHDEFDSVILKFVEKLMNERKAIKAQMIELLHSGADPESPEVKALDQAQKIYKLLANSFFGAMGEKGFHFFDPAMGPAVTYTGQLIISSMLIGFESFLTGNLWLKDEDELVRHVAACLREANGESPVTIWGDPGYRATPDEVALRLLKHCAPGWDSVSACRAVAETLATHPNPERACWAVILRGDPHAFLSFPRCAELIDVAIQKPIAEADPGKIAKKHPEGKNALDRLWDGLRQWVATPYIPANLPRRVAEMRRRAVVLTDTDSTFISLRPWMQHAGTVYDLEGAEDQDRLTVMNVMVYLMRLFSDYQMGMLTGNLGVPVDMQKLINFKSEFVNQRMILTAGKKHYAAWITHQEGAQIANGGKSEFKGLAMKKTNIAKTTGDRLQKLTVSYALRGEIRRAAMIRELAEFEQQIRQALADGSVTYATPAVVGRIAEYDNPWGLQQVRGMTAWNACFPRDPIREGDRVNLFRMKVGTDFSAFKGVLIDYEPEDADEENPIEVFPGSLEIAQALYDTFFSETAEAGAAKNGLNWFAMPKDLQKSPEWIRGLVDVDTVVSNNVAPINPILEALGVKILRVAGTECYSNTIDL